MATSPDIRDEFVTAMAAAVTGVTVVSTDGRAGLFGQTVSAMCSVSADPPSLLVCLNRRSPSRAAVLENGVFAVSVLAADQVHVSQAFAGRAAVGDAYDFGCAEWEHSSTGAPLLSGAAACFDCVVEHSHECGSHTVVLGRVVACDGRVADPLLYTRRSYGRPLVAA